MLVPFFKISPARRRFHSVLCLGYLKTLLSILALFLKGCFLWKFRTSPFNSVNQWVENIAFWLVGYKVKKYCSELRIAYLFSCSDSPYLLLEVPVVPLASSFKQEMRVNLWILSFMHIFSFLVKELQYWRDFLSHYISGKPVQPVKRELLRHRDYKVDLESKLGKTIVITKTTPQSEMGGWVAFHLSL